jgi:HemY protein
MLKMLLYLVLPLVGVVALTVFLDLAQDPGYLLVAWRNVTFETSLVAVVLAGVFLLLLLWLLVRLVAWLDPRRWLRFLRGAQKPGVVKNDRTTQGLIAYVRGDWESAYRELELSFNDADISVANYLAAAQSANELGQEAVWTRCLDMAAKRFPAALSLINETPAELLWKNSHQEESRVVLEQLERTSASSRQLLSLQKRVYLDLQDWNRLDTLMTQLTDRQLVSEEEAKQLARRIFRGRLLQLGERAGADVPDSDSIAAELIRLWDGAPHAYHKDPELVALIARLLAGAGAREESAQILESTLSKAWDDQLIELYGTEDLGNYQAQLLIAEGWLQERPNNGVLLLTLGRLALRNREWSKAREYFEASCLLRPDGQVYGELARLLASLGEAKASLPYFEKYLQAVDSPLPELPLPESESSVGEPNG